MVIASCRLPQPLQASSNCTSHVPALASCFSAVLQTAYESQTLRDKHIQEQLQAAVQCLTLRQALCATKQVLLYLRSTVENFRQVSTAASAYALPPEQPFLS